MPSIQIRDLIGFVLEKKMEPEEAMKRAQALGLNHNEIATFFELESPNAVVDESTAPKTRRVTARGVPKATSEDRPFPFIYAGRHAWTRDPKTSTTHDLCETQYRDVKKKHLAGPLIIIKDEPIAAVEPEPKAPTPERQSSSDASKGRHQQAARR